MLLMTKMKIKVSLLTLVSSFLILSLAFVFYFYINNWPLIKSDIYGQIKPEVTTNLNSKKFVKPQASTSAVTIADKILGAKVVLPAVAQSKSTSVPGRSPNAIWMPFSAPAMAFFPVPWWPGPGCALRRRVPAGCLPSSGTRSRSPSCRRTGITCWNCRTPTRLNWSWTFCAMARGWKCSSQQH